MKFKTKYRSQLPLLVCITATTSVVLLLPRLQPLPKDSEPKIQSRRAADTSSCLEASDTSSAVRSTFSNQYSTSNVTMFTGTHVHRPLGSIARSLSVTRCPPLSKELLQAHSKDSTVMIGLLSSSQWDFGVNWIRSLVYIDFQHFVLGAADANISAMLASLNVPCFEFFDAKVQAEGSDTSQNYEWGQAGWRRIVWQKVLLIDQVVDWGLNLIQSDMDVVWLHNPLPYFASHTHADILFSVDSCHTRNALGDGGLDTHATVNTNFNTGVYFLRNNKRSRAWVHAWKDLFESGYPGFNQPGAYNFSRVGLVQRLPQDPRISSAWNGSIYMGFLAPHIFSNGHTYTVQKLHEVHGLQPFEMHATWTYNGRGGKRARFRDAMLWFDDDSYYSEPSFVTVELKLPTAPEGFNNLTVNEEMISFHLTSVHSQLHQAYAGMALAVASQRAFISPKFQCYCEKIWYGVVRCRMVDAQDLAFPIDCPTDYLFQPDNFADKPETFGTPLNFREPSFLENPRTPREVKDSVLEIHPSTLLPCTECFEEKGVQGGRLVVHVPLGLKDNQLLPLLEKYKQYRVWVLSFKEVEETGEAFGGFACAGTAEEFDKRMERVTTFWCCRQEREARERGLQDRIREQLRMAPLKFSDKQGLDTGC